MLTPTWALSPHSTSLPKDLGTLHTLTNAIPEHAQNASYYFFISMNQDDDTTSDESESTNESADFKPLELLHLILLHGDRRLAGQALANALANDPERKNHAFVDNQTVFALHSMTPNKDSAFPGNLREIAALIHLPEPTTSEIPLSIGQLANKDEALAHAMHAIKYVEQHLDLDLKI
ncbi:hypothetical protein HDU98_003568, partial [Podochytrium sp. JEL0797]